jgi:hypothetical protein
MATWNGSLPWELKHRIFGTFCTTIIEEYNDLQLTAWDPNHFHDGLYTWASEDPISPPCLRNYSSATKTCREFYQIIETIEINSISPYETLQQLRYEFLEKLVGESAKRERLYSNHVGLFKKMTGCFWRNPFVIKDEDLLDAFLDVLPFESQFTIIPYIRQWVMRHIELRRQANRIVRVDVQAESNGEYLRLGLLKGERTLPPQFIVQFYSIRGLLTDDVNYTGQDDLEKYFRPDDLDQTDGRTHYDVFCAQAEELVEEEFPELPLLRDIRESKPNTWWFVQNFFTMSNTEWMLVKYYEEDGQERCKIYEGEQGYSAWNWTPDSTWDHEGWDCDHFINDGNGSD